MPKRNVKGTYGAGGNLYIRWISQCDKSYQKMSSAESKRVDVTQNDVERRRQNVTVDTNVALEATKCS